MNTEERKRLRKLCDKATPGPWETKDYAPEVKIVSDYRQEEHCEVANWIATVDDYPDFDDDEDEVFERNSANAKFIAAARTAIPALLDALDDAEKDLSVERRSLTAFSAENVSLRHQLAELYEHRKHIVSVNTALMAENAALREQLDEAEAKIKRLTAHLKPGYRTGAVSREFHLQLVEAKDAENSALRERVAVLEKVREAALVTVDICNNLCRDEDTEELRAALDKAGEK